MAKPTVQFTDEVQTIDLTASTWEATVLVYHDVRLKADDVELLRGPYWLNDQIILFFYLHLEFAKYAKDSKRLLFIPPSVAQLLKMSTLDEAEGKCRALLDPLQSDEKKLIFFPVNNHASSAAGGAHWSLLVYLRKDDSFFNFDSHNQLNMKATREIYQILKVGLRCPNACLLNPNCAQQSNSYDCGIHLLVNTENICDHYLRTGNVSDVPVVNQNTIENKRSAILDLISDLAGSF